MVPFVTNTAFLVRYDWRWCAKNLLDGPTAGTSSPPPTLTDLQNPSSAAGSVLATLITEASEILMAAAAVAARYTEDDVRTYGGSLRDRIVSDLTMGLVLKRRGRAVTDEKDLSGPYTEALEYIEALRRGERIFWAVPNVPEAGLPGTADGNPFPFPYGLLPGHVPPLSAQSVRYFGFPAAYPGWYYGQPGPSAFPG